MNGVSVGFKFKDENKSGSVKLIDFQNVRNNHFLAVNQFTVKGPHKTRRPDVVCFINGLPLFVIELKDMTDENADIWDAFNQLQNYKNDISDLFNYNEGLIISDGITARIGSLTADKDAFSSLAHTGKRTAEAGIQTGTGNCHQRIFPSAASLGLSPLFHYL